MWSSGEPVPTVSSLSEEVDGNDVRLILREAKAGESPEWKHTANRNPIYGTRVTWLSYTPRWWETTCWSVTVSQPRPREPKQYYPRARWKYYLEKSVEDIQEDVWLSGKARTKSDSGTSGYTWGTMWKCDSNYATPALQAKAPKTQVQNWCTFWEDRHRYHRSPSEGQEGKSIPPKCHGLFH